MIFGSANRGLLGNWAIRRSAVVNNQVQYTKNGVVFYTSLRLPIAPKGTLWSCGRDGEQGNYRGPLECDRYSGKLGEPAGAGNHAQFLIGCARTESSVFAPTTARSTCGSENVPRIESGLPERHSGSRGSATPPANTGAESLLAGSRCTGRREEVFIDPLKFIRASLPTVALLHQRMRVPGNRPRQPPVFE